jgi:hypothetical protein
VTHLTEGQLRRLRDEPFAVPEQARRHYHACTECQRRYSAIEADARAVAAALSVDDVRIDTSAALAKLRHRIAVTEQHEDAIAVRRRWLERIRSMTARRLVKPVAGLAVAAALVASLALTPLGSFAESIITIFEPQQITAVPITPSDMQGLRSLPDLSRFGTMSQQTGLQAENVAGAAEAQQKAGFAVLVPSNLPSSISSQQVRYMVASQGHASFTFSAAKAAQATNSTAPAEAPAHRPAAGRVAHGKALGVLGIFKHAVGSPGPAPVTDVKPLPPMPAGLDGSILRVSLGPVVVATYGNNDSAVGNEFHNLPALVIGQAVAPKVTSTGATAKQIEDYLLSLPGIPADVAAEIRAIGDPSSTLPIPIPIDRVNSQQVQVQGVNGLALGDNTGIFSVVLWQKNGMVYAVGGTLTQDQVLSIANSLH